MKVKDLSFSLSTLPPDAEVLCWATDVKGEPMDDVANIVELRGVAHWDKEDATTAFLNVKVNISPSYEPPEDFDKDCGEILSCCLYIADLIGPGVATKERRRLALDKLHSVVTEILGLPPYVIYDR